MTSMYTPRTKVEFIQRLADSWKDLADLLDIPRHDRDGFPKGDAGREIWDWLSARNELGHLRPAIAALERPDLVELLDTGLIQEAVPSGEEPHAGDGRDSAWRLPDDPDLDTFWLPRARGVEPGAGDDGWRFRGRREAIARITEHLTAAAVRPAPLVVLGEPGCGKSALLAHVLVLADPDLRGRVPRRYRTAGTARLTGAVDVAVRATDKTLKSVCTELARSAGLPDTDAERLVTALQRREHGFRVVVDGLDEARPGHVRPIATLLRMLSLSSRVRVVVGLRRAPERSSLDEVRRVALAATPDTTIDADQAPYLWLGDVMDLVREGLERTWGLPSPYAGEPRLIERVAGAVATRSRGNFLVAQMTSRNLATDSEPVDVTMRRWWTVFPTDVEGAMDAYIARFGDDERQREVRELLTPLAFALGDGLPDGLLWATAAGALGRPGRTYSTDDVHRVVDDAATYLVAHVDGHRRTYRLFHDALAQYLRSRCRKDDSATDLVRAWRSAVPAVEHRRHWSTAEPYLLTHLAEHATGTNELDGLLQDLQFVVTADPVGLIPAFAHAVSPAALRVARAYRQMPAAAGDPGLRAARLTLSAQQMGDEELRDRFATCGVGLPWRATGGAWRPPDDHTVVLWLEPGTTAITLLPRPDGSASLVSGDAAGRLQVRELVDGVVYPPSSYDVHEPGVPVVALGGGAVEDGRHLIGSAGSDGSVRLWHLDAGLLVPLPAEFAAIAGTPLQLASSASAVALCDSAGGVRLLTVGRDGRTADALGELPGVRHVAIHHDESGPVVIAGTTDGAVSELRPDGTGGLVAREMPITGRWTIGAIAAARVGLGALIAIGTGGRELHLLVSARGVASPLGVTTDVTYAGISGLAFSPASPASPAGLLLGDHVGWVRFWAFDDGGDLVPRRVGRPHLREVSALCVVSTPAGSAGVSCDVDGKVAMWPLDGSEVDPNTRQRDVDLAAAGVWSLVLREGRQVESWTLGADDRLAAQTSSAPADAAVVNTVDRSGRARTFRSDLAQDPGEPNSRRRMVPLHPYRSLAVGTGADGEPIALALRGDGDIEVYDRDLARRPATVPTGNPLAVSVSLGTGPGDEPVVTWGDVDGAVRLRHWSERAEDWRDTPAWALGRADIRASVTGDALLTGDGSGVVELWSLSDGEPRSHRPAALTHEAPVTAVALDDEFAVSGDRNGTVFITPIRDGRLGGEPAHRVEMGTTVLSLGRVDRCKILVWCRPGAVVLTWGPPISRKSSAS